MKIQVIRMKREDQEKFLNLYNLYLYDLSEYNGDELKEDGKFDPTNTYLYLERDELQPFFIIKDDKVVGFILICSAPFVSDGIDYSIQELFVLKKYRGNQIAGKAVELVLEKLEGKIRVEQLKANKAAVHFWKKFYNQTDIKYSEGEEVVEIEGLEGKHIIVFQEFKR
ncbi:GNAT family N-acetyltransferase [Gorillibacterium massiliense]|uniref:GNAT family N-acetyltransferase n=1 Tax=Gorillibacterium massiliense TaxID=1280390 RepID=UPI0004B90173|nr:GNAT family N-acetyltransferase [Gorillibacterium massiliense]